MQIRGGNYMHKRKNIVLTIVVNILLANKRPKFYIFILYKM